MLQLFPAFLIQLLIQAVQQPGHSGGNQAVLLQISAFQEDDTNATPSASAIMHKFTLEASALN